MTPAGPEMVNLTIDGVPIAVEPGTHVIDAAERVGVLVPRYCYHPGIPTRPAHGCQAGMALTTGLFIYIGGRIFRIAILMQGTPPKLSNFFRWALR